VGKAIVPLSKSLQQRVLLNVPKDSSLEGAKWPSETSLPCFASFRAKYNRYHGVETRIVRIFNTYGPKMRPSDGRVVSNFINQALRGDDITVYGDGSQTRSFQYIDDLVEGVYRLLLSDEVDPVNIGNPDETSILEFAEEIVALTGTDSKVVFKPLPKDDPKVRQPDITKARAKLGWSPNVPRQEGLRRTTEYFSSLAQAS
jgi:dTDP-glucose 4,6-dehydratase